MGFAERSVKLILLVFPQHLKAPLKNKHQKAGREEGKCTSI
jgi:hypothetical protein